VVHDTGSYLDALQHDISLSIPISETCRSLARSSPLIVNEIRECLRELRTTLLRELATEIVPKFFASNEFEILLWELDAHKLYLLSQQQNSSDIKNSSSEEGDDEEEDELVRNFNKMSGNASPRRGSGPTLSTDKKQKKSTPKSIGPAVPDGAVQRLLRKVSPTLPSTITMHRAPLDLMDSVQQERDLWNDEPMAWVLLFDSEGGRLENSISPDSHIAPPSSQTAGSEKIRIIGIIPLHFDKSQTTTATSNISSFPIIPEGIVNFLLPNGRCIEEIKSPELPSPVLFNVALATRDNALMYGGALQLHRKETVKICSPEPQSTHLKVDSHVHNPSAIHRSHRPAPHTSKSTFKPLTSGVNNSPTSPASGYSEWIGQMSLGFETMKNKSPLFDRFKDGITTFGAAVGNKQSSTVFPPKIPKEEVSENLPQVNHEHSLDHTQQNQQNGSGIQQQLSCHTVMVDLHVVYGLSIVSQVPCINALRGPLSQLAQDDAFLQNFSRDFQEGKKGSSSPTWSTDLLKMTHGVIENKHDSLKALRHAYHQYLSLLSTRIPSVMRWGGAHDFDARMILNTITPRNFVTILIAFILEYKIAIVSSKVTALTVIGEFLKSIIAPLKWSHVYVPLIPKQFNNDILQCPTPFFVGIQREFFDASTVPHDVILLDLDSDACRITSDLAKALYAGRFLADALERVLRPALVLCDEVVMNEHDSHLVIPDVLRLCKLFIADLLIGLEECCTHAVDHNELVVLFDEAMFSFYKMKRSKHETSMFPHDKGFLEQFMRTQCFSLCVVGNILKKLDPNSRPPSRPSSPFVSIPSPPMKPSPTSESALPSTPVQYS
jgi:hypothetical protein